MKVVLTTLSSRFQAQTNSTPGWVRASELFLVCSEDKGHSKTGSALGEGAQNKSLPQKQRRSGRFYL